MAHRQFIYWYVRAGQSAIPNVCSRGPYCKNPNIWPQALAVETQIAAYPALMWTWQFPQSSAGGAAKPRSTSNAFPCKEAASMRVLQQHHPCHTCCPAGCAGWHWRLFSHGCYLSNSMHELQQRCDNFCGAFCKCLAAGRLPKGSQATKVSQNVSPIVQAVPGGCLKGLEEGAAHFHSS